MLDKSLYLPIGVLAAFLLGLILRYLIIALRRPRLSGDMRINRQRRSARLQAPAIVFFSSATLIVFGFLFYREFFAMSIESSRIKLLYPWLRPAQVIQMKDLEQVKIVHRAAMPGTRGYLLPRPTSPEPRP